MQIQNAILTGSTSVYGPITIVSGSLSGASVSASYVSTLSQSLFVSGALNVTGSTSLSGSVIVSGSVSAFGPMTASAILSAGTITAQTLIVQTITSSIEYSSGSNIFGSQLTNTQTFTGSVNITGSTHTIFGNVGINTTAPTRNLEIVAGASNNSILKLNATTANGYGAQVEYSSKTNGGTTNTWVVGTGVTGGTNSFEFWNGSSTVMFISSSGNIGIGTTSPDNTYQGLTIVGSNPSLRLKGTQANAWTWIEFVSSSGANNFSMGVNHTTSYFGIKAGAGMDSTNFTIISNGNVGIGTTNPNASIHIASTDALVIPVGTTAQRPSSPTIGSFRYNSNLSLTEYYDGSNWYQHKSDGIATGSNYAAEYLVVAGGGGGGAGYGNGNAVGGGGGGGMLTGSSLPLISGNTYYVIVGAAGAGGAGGTGASSANQGFSGGYSSIGSIIVAVGGGGGGASGYTAKSGGSGGGGMSESDKGYSTLGQGNDGGIGIAISRPYRGGGGGGRSTAGDTGGSSGNGGNGMTSTISGSFVYAGGGGGGCYTPDTPGTGGTGGAGNGANGANNATGGNPNSGGGGGGGGWPASGLGGNGGNGGSGIVIIKYPGSQRGTGGTISSLSGYTIHKFTSSGVFVA